MNGIDSLLSEWLGIDVWFLVKLAYLLAILLYVGFAAVMIKQVSLMTRALDGSLNLPLRTLAWVHLGIAVGVLVMAVIVL